MANVKLLMVLFGNLFNLKGSNTMLNHAAKIYNISPKPNSKHQQWLRDNARTYDRVVCAECGEGHTTLYKVGEQYYCREHKDRVK